MQSKKTSLQQSRPALSYKNLIWIMATSACVSPASLLRIVYSKGEKYELLCKHFS